MARPYDPRDHYARRARREGMRARSAYKIDEIVRRHRLLRAGQAVLDLGAAPGGFLLVLAEIVGERGSALGVDRERIRATGKPWVRTAELDVLGEGALDRIRELHPGRFDLVTSDMAPRTIGVKVTDEARSLELARAALHIAGEVLRLGGALVAKVFMGGDFPVFRREVASRFDAVQVARPRATRESSFEVYVVGKGFRR